MMYESTQRIRINNNKTSSVEQIQVMGDDLEVSTIPSNPGRQVRQASHIFVHLGYISRSYVNDIAVIRVLEPFYVTPTFFPVELASETPVNDLSCAVAGWGAVKEVQSYNFIL